MDPIHETLKYLLASQLTRRYQEIVLKMPEIVLVGGGAKVADVQQGVLLGYIDLCNEELLLHKCGQIPDPIWESWKSGIIAGNSLVAIKQVWKDLKKSDHYSELATFLKDNGVDVFKIG